jgi:hypothetical protein
MRRRKNIQANQRLDQGDMQDIAGDHAMLEGMRQMRSLIMPAGRTTGTQNEAARVFSGFEITHFVDGPALVSRGSGLMYIVYEGTAYYGYISGEEGPASNSIDVSAFADGTYNVYVRAKFEDSDRENRVFWNPTGAAEQLRNVNTNIALTWEAVARATALGAPAGGDYMFIGTITTTGGAVTAHTDGRVLFFEGDAANSFADEWGTGNDRNASRGVYGIADLHDFCSLVRCQLAAATGVKHYTAIPIGLTALAVEHSASTGHHTDVLAESVRIDPLSSHAHDQFVNFGGLSQGIGSADFIRRVDAFGRLTKPHHFYDDFVNYPGWAAWNVGLPESYLAAQAAGGDVVGNSAYSTRGGAATFLTNNTGDWARLYGGLVWQMDAQYGTRFWAKLNNKAATDPTKMLIRVGLGAPPTSTFVGLEIDNATWGSGDWQFVVRDHTGATSNAVAGSWGLGATIMLLSDPVTDLWYCWLDAALIPTPLGKPGAAWSTTPLGPYCYMANVSAGATADWITIDAWEVWDNLSLA